MLQNGGRLKKVPDTFSGFLFWLYPARKLEIQPLSGDDVQGIIGRGRIFPFS
jgi:hypothetical protein